MIEVFKTNVRDRDLANMLVVTIHERFHHYKANFDLDDCDRILRVQSLSGSIPPSPLLNLLHEFGFEGEVLPDEVPCAEKVASVDTVIE